MRDQNVVLINVSNKADESVSDMLEILEKTGNFQVVTIKGVRDIIPSLKSSNAGFLIIDLDVEDEKPKNFIRKFLARFRAKSESVDYIKVIGRIRSKYGQSVYIMAITGMVERYQEENLLGKGVDAVFRKPFSPPMILMSIIKNKEFRGNL